MVEDDKLLAAMYKTKFERAGYRVNIYNTAESALPELTDHKPDLVVLDILLSGKNGLWLLKEMHIGRLDVPVVMLTNMQETDFAMPAKLRHTLNVVGYHVKTQATPDDVLKTIEEVLV